MTAETILHSREGRCHALHSVHRRAFDACPAQMARSPYQFLRRAAPENSFFAWDFNIRALLALVLVSLCCGAIGSLVVGGRMAFFSDALAHCSFAGISIGFLLFLLFGPRGGHDPNAQRLFWDWVTVIMAVFGIVAGCGIVWVRTVTGLSSDTVIGVFFAGAVGLAAALRDLINDRALFNLEDFLFGNPLLVFSSHLIILFCLAVFTSLLLVRIYNHLLLASFNQSLALSRRVPVRMVNYLFIILLALTVNLCLRFVALCSSTPCSSSRQRPPSTSAAICASYSGGRSR